MPCRKRASTGIYLAIIIGVCFFALRSPGQDVTPTPEAASQPVVTTVQVIVTGSNIPTAEETGPNPVDTYRPQDLEKLGIRSATDLQEFIPQEAGGTVNLNIGNGGDGTVQFNLHGLLPKETLVLIDGKRVAYGSLGVAGFSGGVDINLIPFPMIVGGTYGNTNMGASNEMGEWEAWLKAGTGDDKTDIVVVADFFERTGGVFSRDRDISSNAFQIPWGGFDARSGNEPGRVIDRRLIPRLFFGQSPNGLPQIGVNTPPPHSATNAATSPFYANPFAVNPNAFPGAPGIHNPRVTVDQTGTKYRGGGDYFFYNFAAVTPALPSEDRQVYYGSFTRDLCDKYLAVFADFKYARSFFDSSLAAVPFTPDPFKIPGTNAFFSPSGISVPIQNPFNPFTVGDTTLVVNGVPVPMTTDVRFRAINDTGTRSEKFTYWDQLFDVGLRGEMGEVGDYFRMWNWELGFRYSRNEGQDLSGGEVSQPGLRDALLDTDPATAFDPFLGINGHNSKRATQAVYVTLHNSGEYELPMGYATINGDMFNLPAGPVSFAIGGQYEAPRFTRDRDALNDTFQTIGSVDGQSFRVNRDVWGIYEEVRVPFTSPTWNFPLFHSLEVDFAEREEWYSNNTSTVLPSGLFPGLPAAHTRYNAQKPKVSLRWQPLDSKYIGAVTLRGSYTEAFRAPTLGELTPASSQVFPIVADPFSTQTEPEIEERILGNPNLHPEVAYECTYGIVYSPKSVNGLTLSADWWHIDMRDIVSTLGAQFLIESNPPTPGVQQNGPFVFRGPSAVPDKAGPVTLVIDPSNNLSGAIFEGLDYEASYILDSTIFGHGDWGRLTTTVNGTWLSRAEFQPNATTKRFGIAGSFLPPGLALTSSLPWNRANFSIFYDGPADTWVQGLDVGAIVHWTSQYEDDNVSLTGSTKLNEPRSGGFPEFGEIRARKVSAWTTLDLILNYTFNLAPLAPAEVPGFAKDGGKNLKIKDGKEKNVVPVSTAEYGCSIWQWWLNNTTVTLGMQNVFDKDPPFVAGSFENGYDESIATIKGRFWYVGLKKRF